MRRGRPPLRDKAPFTRGRGFRHDPLRLSAGAAGAPPEGASESEGAAVPGNFHYTNEDDSLHVMVTDELKTRVYQMFRDARANPKSGAGAMVRILLLNAVANMHADRYDDPRMALAEERHRGLEADHRGEMARHRLGQLEMVKEKHEADLKVLQLKAVQLEQVVEAQKLKFEEARKTVESARNALQNGQPVDAMAIYNRISEIVGLRAPAVEEAARPVQ